MESKLTAAFHWIIGSKLRQLTLLGLITLHVLKKIRERKRIQYFLSRIDEVQKERNECIEWAREQAECVGEEERKSIEAMDFNQLRESLQNGTVTCDIVVRVFYGLAVKAHERTNCLTNVIKVALDQARELDERAKDPSYTKPRLFGIPISIKDSVEVKDQRSTWGLAKLIDNIAKEDSYQVMKLRMDGMIPFCQSNVPTTCLTYHCSNSIYGTTSSPLNSSRTAGGSSGGEGALIGCGGSLIGIGSDIGGSIRNPASFCGCCGFKPSATRCSTLQLPEPIPMRPFLMPTEGPLAQDPHAIVEIMRSMWSDNFLSDEDPFAVPVNFREEYFQAGRLYRIGYYTTNGHIDPLPGNQRVILEAVELLRAKGHELVPFSLGDIVTEAARGAFATVYSDGGAAMREKLEDEPLTPLIAPLRGFVSMSIWTKKLIGWISKLRGDSSTADFFLYQSTKAIEVQKGVDRVYSSRKRLVQKMKDERIEAILCPSMLSPAIPHSLPNEIPFTTVFPMAFWNVMDFPAGVVTAGTWTESDEKELESYQEKGMVEAGLKRGCKNSVGLPLAVQLVAPPFRDEIVLRVMVDLYDAMRKGE